MNADLLAADLIRDEGFRLQAYKDTMGLCTVGCGRCLDTNPLNPTERQRIGHDGRHAPLTPEQVRYLLGNDIARVCADLDRALPWWRALTEPRQRVLANMCFNMGLRSLQGFRATLAAAESGRYADAASGMLSSRWAAQVGDRAKRLAAMMKAGA